MQEGPSSLPFQLHKTSRSRQRSHGAPPAPPRPRCAPLESPGAGGEHRGKGTAPFPGIGSHDTVPYPKRAPSCTAFSRVRCFTSASGLGRSGGVPEPPWEPPDLPSPPPRAGRGPSIGGMRSSTGSPSSRADQGSGAAPGAPGPSLGIKGGAERCCPHRGQVTFLGQPAWQAQCQQQHPHGALGCTCQTPSCSLGSPKTGMDPPGSPTGVTTGSAVALCGRCRIILSLPAPPVAPLAPSSSHSPNLDDFGQSGEKS